MEIKRSYIYAKAVISISNDMDMNDDVKVEVLSQLCRDRDKAKQAEGQAVKSEVEAEIIEEACNRG